MKTTYQRRRSRINKLMLRPRRHNHQISRLHILIFPINRGLPLPRRECERLIHGVDFIAYIPVHGYRHEHDLGVEACPEYAAEFGGGGG